MTPVTPSALDFARLLRARGELEARAQPYLAGVEAGIRSALERRGYEEVCLRRTLDAPPQEQVAAELTLVALARLPLAGLKTPVLKARLPVVVTYSEKVVVQGAQINRLTLPDPFVQPFPLEPEQVAEALVQFLSERYMEYLLGQP